MPDLPHLRDAALDIFRAALRGADACAAVRRAIHLRGERLTACETTIDLATRRSPLYSIAIGKAAHAMATALDEILSEKLTAGVLAGLSLERAHEESSAVAANAVLKASLSKRWRVFAGGHPLPNEESLAAASAAFEILRRADEERALVLFLISGGGSALIEWPRDEETTLAELRETNRMLVNCGASIAEINSVRRAISAIKGGRLAARAPHAEQLSLIISDTNAGDEASVASGPTMAAASNAPDAATVVARYELAARLPASIVRVIAQPDSSGSESSHAALRKHYVLLTNEDALRSAADAARVRGFAVEVASDIREQEIGEGCEQSLNRLLAAHRGAGERGRVTCLLSGGEFACPVRGAGRGGRNSETALRWAVKIEEIWKQARGAGAPSHLVALSAGTDGVDGNSLAAGALVDETTLARARAQGLDPRQYLAASDSHTFFSTLDDAIVTGPTGTNVRDVRVMLIC